MDPATANLVGSTIIAASIAGSIWWLQRDRHVSVAFEVRPGRKEDAMKRDIERHEWDLKNLDDGQKQMHKMLKELLQQRST
jgi:hypothetical protein